MAHSCNRLFTLLRKIPTRLVFYIVCIYLGIMFLISFKLLKRNGTSTKKVDNFRGVNFNGALSFNGSELLLEGKPFRILSGSFHYFRTEPKQWEDRLLKMKAAGLNTVTTYIPWNLHEPIKMQYNFKGKWNIETFIQLLDNIGLYLIVRPGPYICAEWEYGGLPSWLLSDPNMVTRNSSYKPFLDHVERYFSNLLPILVPYQYKSGVGPIIAFQVENEYGSYRKDPAYMDFIKGLFEKNGLTELYFTSDGENQFTSGSIPGVLETVNFGADIKNAYYPLNKLEKFQGNLPLMVGEFWDGWFDHWTDRHHKTLSDKIIANMEVIIRKKSSSLNFYMFAGGTNFGFWNGANEGSHYKPTVTSYDYDAPISESGDITPKYIAIQNLLQSLEFTEKDLPDVPPNSPKAAYGLVEIKQCMPYTDMLFHIEHKITLKEPTAMEYLPINNGGGQGYGWLLYRTTFSKGDFLKFIGPVKDRAQVILNGKLIAVLDWFKVHEDIRLKNLKNSNQLDILVENTGRVNFKWKVVLKPQRRGILGKVMIDNEEIENWEHIPFEFDSSFKRGISGSSHWTQTCHQNALPSLYRGTFVIKDDPKDTFINMKKWTKGIVFINGVNLGRYWHVGPQQTLYVPYPLLRKGKNSVVVFELHQSDNNVKFIDHPVLDDTIPERNIIDKA